MFTAILTKHLSKKSLALQPIEMIIIDSMYALISEMSAYQDLIFEFLACPGPPLNQLNKKKSSGLRSGSEVHFVDFYKESSQAKKTDLNLSHY